LPNPTSPHTSRSIATLGQVFDHFGNGAFLIFGFGIGETGAKFVVETAGVSTGGMSFKARAAAMRMSSAAISRTRAFIWLCGFAIRRRELVEPGRRFLRTVARQQLDVLDRKKQLSPVVVQFKTVVRRARHLDRLEPEIAAHPMFDMRDEVSGGKRRRLGQEICERRARPRERTMRSPRMSCSETSANPGASKPCSRPSTASPPPIREAALVSRQSAARFIRLRPWSASNAAHAFGRTLAPAGDDHLKTALLQIRNVRRCRLENIDAPAAFLSALGRESRPSLPPASVDLMESGALNGE